MAHHFEVVVVPGKKVNKEFSRITNLVSGVFLRTGSDRFNDFSDASHKGLHKQSLLVGEIAIDGGMRNSGFPGYVSHADLIKSFGREYSLGRINNDLLLGLSCFFVKGLECC